MSERVRRLTKEGKKDEQREREKWHLFVVSAVEWDGSPGGGVHIMSQTSIVRSASERCICQTRSWCARFQEADGGGLQVQMEFREISVHLTDAKGSFSPFRLLI